MVLQESGWPCVFELDRGQTLAVPSAGKPVKVRLIEYRLTHEPDYFIARNPARKTVASAEAKIEVDGQPAALLCRPFQMPETVGGVRIYVDAVREWAAHAGYAPLTGVEREVRFSAVPAGHNWGSGKLVFPLRAYRWRSSTYQNTWNSLVPYNQLYYHRGEDFGAIPDKLDVVSPLDGRIIGSPLPRGDAQSNGLTIEAPNGLRCRLAHMNIESFEPRLTVGAEVRAGERVAQTGCTWNGKRSQHNDPHLHFQLDWNEHRLGTFPFLMESYFRAYDDALVAIAGGHQFALPKEPVALDGSRSLARPGKRIAFWTWKLHDGRTVEGARTEIVFEKPGLYAEEMIVKTEDGHEDRDAVHVRVYDPKRGANMAMGFLHYWPSREVLAGKPVLFCNATWNTREMKIDFGDGTEPKSVAREIQHAFAKPGLHTVTLSGLGPADEPVSLKLRVAVQP
jgi:murein DD-endopeptidase MepM/ murein hydrolase activator NlpD